MPRKNENIRPDPSSHRDGSKESVINDSEGVQIGIRSDFDSDYSSLTTNKTKDDKLKTFEKMTEGNPVDDKH